MSFSFTHYTKIKDNYCIAYYGNAQEYLVQLRILHDTIEEQLSGLKLFVTCNKRFSYLFERENYFVSNFNKNDFSYVREIVADSYTHPIHELMIESDLRIPSFEQKAGKGICLICPESLSAKLLSDEQVIILKEWARKRGYLPMVIGSDIHCKSKEVIARPIGKEKYKYIEEAALVIGVENEFLWLGGSLGKETILVTTGAGENFYRNMFPGGKLMRKVGVVE